MRPAVLLPFFTACAAALAAQDFEDRLPGEIPSGWTVAWGRIRDDVFATTNRLPFAGARCWLLDRPADSTDGQYGVSTRLAAIPGDARLSLAIRLDGPGSRACPGIELRAADGQRRLAGIGFSQRDREALLGKAVIGRSQDGRWMRLVLDWPAAGGGRASLAAADGPDALVPVALPPRQGVVVFMVCVHLTGFSLRLDDLTWGSHDAALP